MNSENRILIGVYGASGFGREVMPLLQFQLRNSKSFDEKNRSHDLVFVDDKRGGETVNGHRVLSSSDFFKSKNTQKYFNVAIADSKVRERIVESCLSNSVKPFSIIDPACKIYDENKIGDGVILCANTSVTSNVQIGRFVQVNIYTYIAHDCVIDDFVTFAPRVSCNGNVQIRRHAYIGTGAVIKQGSGDRPLVIGEGAIVGMGAVVTKDVPAFTTVVGNPAKPMIR